MSFANHISYTRSVSARIPRNQGEIPFFKGSSFNRKRPEKSTQTAEALIKKAFEGINGEGDSLPGNDFDTMPQDECSLESAAPRMESLAPIRKKRRTTNIFSSRSRNKCKEKIFAMFGCSTLANFTFLTLTFVAPVPDKTGAKILNKFLTVLRKRYGNFMYVWVAEKQDNGNLHFHLIQNRRFPIAEINALWLLQQYNEGITNEKISLSSLTTLYKGNDFSNIQKALNPVDIKQVKSAQGLAAYLTNYITKNTQEFSCAVWHCNRAVSALFTACQISIDGFNETSNPEKNRVTTKKGKTYVNKTFVVNAKDSNITLALVNTLYNVDYFRKYLWELDEINKIVLNLTKQKKRINREDLMESAGEYFQEKIFNLN